MGLGLVSGAIAVAFTKLRDVFAGSFPGGISFILTLAYTPLWFHRALPQSTAVRGPRALASSFRWTTLRSGGCVLPADAVRWLLHPRPAAGREVHFGHAPATAAVRPETAAELLLFGIRPDRRR